MYTTDPYTETSTTFGAFVLMVIMVVCLVKAFEALLEIFPVGTVQSGRAVWRLAMYTGALVSMLYLIEVAS